MHAAGHGELTQRVAPEFVEDLFTEGTSTKPDSGIPGGRGIGLALSRQISRALGGDLWLASPGNPEVALRARSSSTRSGRRNFGICVRIMPPAKGS